MLRVRNAEPADAKLLKNMIEEMGKHERLPVSITEQKLAADGFGPNPKFRALIAEWDRQPAGYALVYDCYSSFQGCGIFLEDLYVSPQFRGKKVGKALLSRVAAIASQQDCFGIMFNVLDWNHSAFEFFENAGAIALNDRRTLCLSGSALQAAASHQTTSVKA